MPRRAHGGVPAHGTISRRLEHADARVALRPGAEARRGPVGGAAVGDDDFVRNAAAGEKRVGPEQIGAPRDVYEEPANEFVMTFVGQAHEIEGNFVRPHDLEITLEPNGSTSEVMIDRVVHLGFNVRLDLVGSDGERLSVQTTRDNAELNEFAPGQIVYVKPTRHTTFT